MFTARRRLLTAVRRLSAYPTSLSQGQAGAPFTPLAKNTPFACPSQIILPLLASVDCSIHDHLNPSPFPVFSCREAVRPSAHLPPPRLLPAVLRSPPPLGCPLGLRTLAFAPDIFLFFLRVLNIAVVRHGFDYDPFGLTPQPELEKTTESRCRALCFAGTTIVCACDSHHCRYYHDHNYDVFSSHPHQPTA